MTQIQELPQRGRNIFKFDGPIGRLQFLKTMGILFLSMIATMIVCTLIYIFFDINEISMLALKAVVIIFTLYTIYISVINYSKRFYDIFGEKQKAIFYTTALLAIYILLNFIPPYSRYIGPTLTSIILVASLLIKGRLTPLIKESECNTDEKENNNN